MSALRRLCPLLRAVDALRASMPTTMVPELAVASVNACVADYEAAREEEER